MILSIQEDVHRLYANNVILYKDLWQPQILVSVGEDDPAGTIRQYKY